jgi:hypothetical protein
MSTATLKQLTAHPAQMRTTYDLDALATLTLQVYERGLDSWQPIVATPINSAAAKAATTFISSAATAAIWRSYWPWPCGIGPGTYRDGNQSIEVVRTMLNTLVESLGSLEKVIASLLKKYGEEGIDFCSL